MIESTQPLTGFSHGAAGIAWALLKLAAWSGESRFREPQRPRSPTSEAPSWRRRATGRTTACGRRGSGSSALRVAWCHGAPGIGLARIDSLHHIDDRETREEIRDGAPHDGASELGRTIASVMASSATWTSCFTPASAWRSPGGAKPESGGPETLAGIADEDSCAAASPRCRRPA